MRAHFLTQYIPGSDEAAEKESGEEAEGLTIVDS